MCGGGQNGMSVIKIFSTQRIDKSCDYISNEIFTPIRCGAVFDKKKTDMLGDDTGDNISHLRMTYCELTTQYWAWKNVQADYYGFCHYRRYFCLLTPTPQLDDWSTFTIPYLDEDGIEKLGIEEENVHKVVENYDAISTSRVDLKKLNIPSVRAQYKTGLHLHEEDLELVEKIIEEKYPEFSEAVHTYLDGTDLYLCNMFIMRRDLFLEYSLWLFNILDEFVKRADMSTYSVEGKRTPGHLGERLFGVYFTYLKLNGSYRLGEYPICNIANPEVVPIVNRAFMQDSVDIVLSSSEYFAPYCATAIQSVIRNANPNRKYDFVVLEQEMLDKTKERIRHLGLGKDNISIRTVNVRRAFYKYQLHICEHFSVETYFRLAIPDLFSEYDKILYLDGDLIAKCDVAELFDMNIDDYIAAGAMDIVGMGIVNGYNREKENYYKKRVRMKNCLQQVNGGVMLLNAKRIRQQYSINELLKFAMASHFDLADQDVFNSLFQGQIKWIDLAWNAANDEEGTLRAYVATFAPEAYYKQYKEAIEHPKIIHFAGTIKPWVQPDYQFAEEFWNVLRETPFYDIVMHRRIVENVYAYSENLLNSFPRLQRKRFKVVSRAPVPGGTGKASTLRILADIFMPKGTRRREYIKKVIFMIIGKEYVTPYYMIGK